MIPQHEHRTQPWSIWLRRSLWPVIVATLAIVFFMTQPGRGRTPNDPPVLSGQSRQVTLIVLRAVPGVSTVDPSIASDLNALQKVLPDHGFELLASKGDQLNPGESLDCDPLPERSLEATLIGRRGSGKFSLRLTMNEDRQPKPIFVTDIRTPLNQLFFLKKQLPDSDCCLLIGIGVR